MIRFRKWMKISLSLICLFSMVYPAFPGITLASTGCSSNFTTSPMVSAGDNHSLFLRNDGTVWAWGQNNFGQLGNGTTSDRSPPVQVTGLCDVVAIAAGVGTSMALKEDGTVWAWGVNGVGQLGNGTRTSSPSPVQVKISSTGELTHAVAIEAGYEHTIALLDDGSVQSWGSNARSQIGVGTDGGWHLFAVRSNLEGIAVSAAAGRAHSIIVKNNLTVWTWGDNNSYQLGRSTPLIGTEFIPSSIPGQVFEGLVDCTGLTLFRTKPMVAVGTYLSVALKSNGTVWTWGNGEHGQLGNGRLDDHMPPALVPGLCYITAIAANSLYTVALRNDGTVWTWGDNLYGQLGNEAIPVGGQSSIPVQVTGLSDVKAIAAGANHVVALERDGTVWTWGFGGSGQLGYDLIGTNYSTIPGRVPGLSGVLSIAAGQ